MVLVDAMHIACGATTPNTAAQAVIDAETALHDLLTGEDHSAGCGGLMLWWDAYRCLDCDKFMHRACLAVHFARTADGGPGESRGRLSSTPFEGPPAHNG